MKQIKKHHNTAPAKLITASHLKHPKAILFMLAFVAIGTVLIFASRAAGPFASLDAGSGNTLTGAATSVTDASAFGGNAVRFGTPTPTPGGGFVIRDGTNTGVPANTILTSCPGNRDITTAGTVIQNCTISGDIGILADNVTIRNSRISGMVRLGRSYRGGSDRNVNHPLIEDSEFVSNGDVSAIAGVNDVDGIYRRNNIHGWQNCMTMWTSTRAQILDSWCHDEMSNEAGQHFDGVEVYGVEGGIIVRGNSFYQTNSNGATSPLNITAESDINGTVVVENNLLRSANPGYVLLVGTRSTGQTINIVVNNNRLWPASTGSGLFSFQGSGRITGSGSGNVNHLTGAAVSVPSSN